MSGETTWTPENYEPEDRAALEDALSIQREAEIIKMTGWTFSQYDNQPAHRLARMMLYIGMKNTVEQEKMDMESKASAGNRMTGGRH